MERKRREERRELTTPGTPCHQRHCNPNQIRIPIETRTLEQIRTLAPIPLQHRPQPHGHNPRIPIHQAGSSTQQLEIIAKRLSALAILAQPTPAQILVNRTGEEEDDDNRSSDPHRAVEIGVPFEHVEEVGARVYGALAAAQDFCRIDVEGLGIEV
jgi:hypothetical protein